MLYTLDERLNIGKQVYDGVLTRYTAAEKYGISHWTVKDYCRLYRETFKLPNKKTEPKSIVSTLKPGATISSPDGIADYEALSKEELIQELIMSKINEARAKKGYMVKGDGAKKEYIPLDNKNTR